MSFLDLLVAPTKGITEKASLLSFVVSASLCFRLVRRQNGARTPDMSSASTATVEFSRGDFRESRNKLACSSYYLHWDGSGEIGNVCKRQQLQTGHSQSRFASVVCYTRRLSAAADAGAEPSTAMIRCVFLCWVVKSRFSPVQLRRKNPQRKRQKWKMCFFY